MWKDICRGRKCLSLQVHKVPTCLAQIKTIILPSKSGINHKFQLTRANVFFARRNKKREDLIAVEAKYHRICHMTYTSKSNLPKRKQPEYGHIQSDQDPHSDAFLQLLNEIHYLLMQGKQAFRMTGLLETFKELAAKTPEIEAYRCEKLKNRLRKYYGDTIV